MKLLEVGHAAAQRIVSHDEGAQLAELLYTGWNRARSTDEG